MGSLDAYKDEILAQLLEGEWKGLFPQAIYSQLEEWIERHKENKLVTIRFTFYQPTQNNERYAMYLLCVPKIANGKITVKDLKFGIDDYPLSIPPSVYNFPLYCMPRDLLQRILRKKRRND